MKKLIYIAGSGEGPEPKRLGAPFGLSVLPGEPFEVADELAKELLDRVPQVREYDPDRNVKKKKRGSSK